VHQDYIKYLNEDQGATNKALKIKALEAYHQLLDQERARENDSWFR
jgi:hypothetical protein